MKLWMALLAVVIALSWSGMSSSADKTTYPPPRFPSYTKAPKSIDEVMPYARAIARQTTGLQGDGFGILKDGESVALVLTATAEDMVVQAIKRAIEERGVKVNLLYEYELVGVSRADAAELRKARRQFSSEQAIWRRGDGSMSALPTRKRQKSGLRRDGRIFTTRSIRRRPRFQIV